MIKIIKIKYTPSLSSAALHFEAQETIKLMDYPVIEIGYMHLQRWVHIANIFQQQGMIHKVPDFAHFIYTPENKTYLIFIPPLLLTILILVASLYRKYKQNSRLLISLKQEILKTKG